MHGDEGVSMAQFNMPTSFTVAPWMLKKSSMKDAVASSFAWNWSYTPVLEKPCDVRDTTARDDRTLNARLLDGGQWLDKMCTLCTRRSLAQALCTHRQVQVQRKTLRELARCPTTGTGAASTIGARAMYNNWCRCCVQRWRSRSVLIHGRRSNVRQCGVNQRLHDGRRNCVGHWVLAR